MVLSIDRWIGKVAIVTGASAGIGRAISQRLTEKGLIVVGLARRVEKVGQLANKLKSSKGKLVAVKCDVSIEEDILRAFKWVSENIGPVHILINNAGILQPTSLADGNTQMWKNVLDTNVLGVCIATREAIRIMKSHDIYGHIIHMNSVVGHSVSGGLPMLNIYPASKHAVTALAETLRLELVDQDSSIKITSISPGATESEIVKAANLEDSPLMNAFTKHKILEAEDIADAVEYVLSTPPHVQIKELTIKPIKENF